MRAVSRLALVGVLAFGNSPTQVCVCQFKGVCVCGQTCGRVSSQGLFHSVEVVHQELKHRNNKTA